MADRGRKLRSCREFKKPGSSYERFNPGRVLENHVSYLFVSRCAEDEGAPFSVKVVPDGGAELYWSRCEDLEYEITRYGRRSSSDFFLVGPTDSISLIKAVPPLFLVGVKFRPYGLYPFVDGGIKQYVNATVAASNIWGKEALALAEKLEKSDSAGASIALAIDFLERRLAAGGSGKDPGTHEFVGDIVNTITGLKGNVAVSELADKFCLCERQIERKFAGLVGMSPKLFTRIVRFNNCLGELFKNKDNSTVTIIQSCGYYDQNHFIKEFKRFSDLLPGEYLSWMKSLGLR